MAFRMRSRQVAVIEMHGTIGRGIRPEQYLPLFERAEKSRRISGLTLVVDSPGGSAAASEELYLAAARVAKAKPVVAYIRGLGTSGALYICSAAQKIVAVRGAVVGSIGVIFSRLVAEQALRRLGLDFSVRKTGPYKDMFGPWRAPTEEEDEKIDAMLDDTYQRFMEVVAEGRGLDQNRVRELATGEVFSAQRAHALGLVDELGDLNRALDLTAELAGIKRRVTYLRPRRRGFPWLRTPFGQDAATSFLEELEAGAVGKVWL